MGWCIWTLVFSYCLNIICCPLIDLCKLRLRSLALISRHIFHPPSLSEFFNTGKKICSIVNQDRKIKSRQVLLHPAVCRWFDILSIMSNIMWCVSSRKKYIFQEPNLPVFDVPIMIRIIHRIRRIKVFELAISSSFSYLLRLQVVFKRFRYLSLPSFIFSLLFHFYVFSFPICH